MVPETVTTEDGSITCRDKSTGELYHNRAGAHTEAFKNYIEPSRLSKLIGDAHELAVLDVCFGLGYNVYVLLNELLSFSNKSIRIVAIDNDPEIVSVLPEVLSDSRFKDLTKAIGKNWKDKLCQYGQHNFKLGDQVEVSFELVCGDIRQYVFELERQSTRFDLVYHDGFSPRVMPELWTYDLFAAYAKLLSPKGAILTYSSAAAVRGALRLSGLDVRRTSAVGGKSGGTIAAQPGVLENGTEIFAISDEEEARLKTRSSIPYRDPQLSGTREDIIKERNAEVKSRGGL